jgi:transketolase
VPLRRPRRRRRASRAGRSAGRSAPSLIACRTIIGFGAPNKQGTAPRMAPRSAPTRSPRRARRWAGLRAFRMPAMSPMPGAQAGTRAGTDHAQWRGRLSASRTRGFTRRMDGRCPRDRPATPISMAARRPAECRDPQASELALESINASCPRRSAVGRPHRFEQYQNKGPEALTKDDYSGRYIYYGIREFGMAAAMNGMALHGGIIPYGGTFLIFSDYCRPAIRLSALQQVARRLCHDPRFDRSRRGRPDPLSRSSNWLALGRSPISRSSARGRGRDGRMLVAGAEPAGRPVAARADPPESSAIPSRTVAENRCASAPIAFALRRPQRKVVLVATGSRSSWRSRWPTGLKHRGSAPTSSPCPAGACSTHRTPPTGRHLARRRADRLDRGGFDARLVARSPQNSFNYPEGASRADRPRCANLRSSASSRE